MNKEKTVLEQPVKAQEATAPTVAPEILAAIQAAVAESTQAILQSVAKMQAPVPVPAPAPMAHLPKPVVPQQQPFVSKLKGIEVQPGEDLRHVHRERVVQWFTQRENHWKALYNQKKVGGEATSMNWTRG